ncbi:MAG TPA: sigma-70 family RNA polymerase sigma factor, partial [Pyrinomonadaceae bacterium]|nr:sigma-70 family RNA polymerase sigma factor [Pyrinomonadaceae bacterium]
MLDQRRVAAQPDDKREQLFTERYEGLLAWAMRLTNQQRDAAEDLVQDAFVQFVLGRTRLEEIENIDGYLRRMLRYMHVSRLSRSAQHLHEAALSVADYDSCKLGWTAIEPPRRMQAFEELHQICTYACARKESSRAGSVLILRFFHDYFPTEIASILNSSRHCVDQWQRLARREVKLFMDEPSRLRFVNGAGPSDANQIRYLKSDCDLMLELRQMIFNSRRGECLSPEELEEIYSGDNPDALTTAKLAHIVSCSGCLDAVNSLLGLPQLAQRYEAQPPEPKGPRGDAGGGGASGGGTSDLTTKFAYRLRETREHKPQELRIAINGSLVSSLKVSSDLSELDLNLTPDDPTEFVEVSSEQGVQMLFFSVDPVGTQAEQWAWIELSEGRSLEASFRAENGPRLHVVYKDPAPEDAYITGETPHTALSSLLSVVPEADARGEAKTGKQGVVFRLRSWLQGLFAGGSLLAETTRETPLLHLLSQSSGAKRTDFWRRPGWLIVLVSALIVTAFVYFKINVSRTVTAADLLQRASVAEQNSSERTDQVRHRFINLEERRSAEGAIVAQHKIEIWENRGSGASAQRLYDPSNELIGGTWQKADGARVVFHHGSKPQSQPAVVTPENLLLNLDDIWQLQPSAQSFAVLIEQPALAEVEEQSATYVLRYEKGRTIGASQLLKATLTLSKSDLHPIEQTLLVLRGDVLREFRFVEASLELLPAKDVAPSVFEIEPELTGGAGEPGRSEDWAIRDLTASRVPPSPSTS